MNHILRPNLKNAKLVWLLSVACGFATVAGETNITKVSAKV